MNTEEFRNYCLAKPHTIECFPFDQSTLVFKVGGKMYALCGLDRPDFKVNLKCEPEKAMNLRERYQEVSPGYHMSKKHWNTIDFGKSLSDQLLKELIDHSYSLVYNSLSKKKKTELETQS